MQKSKSDYSVFYKNFSSGIILLVVYVDDIVITREGLSSSEVFAWFETEFTCVVW